jgi:hypothetical protein
MENEKQNLTAVGALLAQTWKMYQDNFKKLGLMVAFALLGYVPLIIIISLFFFPYGGGASESLIKVILGFLGILSVGFFFYWYISAFAGVFLLLKDPNQKIRNAFSFGRTYFWQYFAVSILTGALVMLWSLALIIPGIIFAVFYYFSVYVLFFEDFKGMAALKRSKELVSGYWWPVFGRIFLGFLIIMILNIAFQFLIGLPAMFMSHSGDFYAIYTSLISLIEALFSFFFLSLLFVVYIYLIYKDLFRIKPESKVDRTKFGKGGLIAAIVVLAVLIPFFATLTVVALENARMKARDAERISNGKMIQTALELYVDDKGSCPENLAAIKEKYLLGKDYVDPTTKAEYEYNKKEDKVCQVCFTLESDEGFGGLPAGKNCFKPWIIDTTVNGSPGNTAATTTGDVFSE